MTCISGVLYANIVFLFHLGAKNCKELLAKGVILSGWYTIYPQDCVPLTVLCDMNTDGGGWIVSSIGGGEDRLAHFFPMIG